ncbi:hypothetical protein IU469_22280 [Nocardia puris]|uniref:hypothetical protein n=1 Tax=Nocardia puris TaxID=208602 RepID=UPI001895E3D1|nr:hypothetical protein [Nocardia puris]MBF6368428.1 hypothetical protein [Nocardia puris]
MADPEVIAALAEMPPATPGDLPLVGYDPLVARLANLEDLLYQLIWVTARADPSNAPRAVRPVTPIEKWRDEVKRTKKHGLLARILPEGG